MPQGVVISIRPGFGKDMDLENKCEGTVKATDSGSGIDAGFTYPFYNGSGSCCTKKPGDTVTIVRKLPDGSVELQCI